MKKVCALILLGLVIISAVIYQYYYHDGSPNNIVIMDESHELVDTSIDESISNRILAVYLDEPYYYYLGYDGIGRYDIKNHKLVLNKSNSLCITNYLSPCLIVGHISLKPLYASFCNTLLGDLITKLSRHES